MIFLLQLHRKVILFILFVPSPYSIQDLKGIMAFYGSCPIPLGLNITIVRKRKQQYFFVIFVLFVSISSLQNHQCHGITPSDKNLLVGNTCVTCAVTKLHKAIPPGGGIYPVLRSNCPRTKSHSHLKPSREQDTERMRSYYHCLRRAALIHPGVPKDQGLCHITYLRTHIPILPDHRFLQLVMGETQQ